MVDKFLLLCLFVATTTAQSMENYKTKTVNNFYGEHSYVSKELITHYNQKIGSYNEVKEGKNGTVFTWKKS